MTPNKTPNKKHGLDIIVAVGHPKSPGGPPSFPFSGPSAKGDPDNDGDNDSPQAPQDDSYKDSREEAGYLPCEWACGSCTNFHPDTGECEQVQGVFRATDKCLKYFEPLNPKYLAVRPTSPDTDMDQGGPTNASL